MIQFNQVSGFQRLKLSKKCNVFYYSKPLELIFSKDADNDLDLGVVLLTKARQELAPVCGSIPVDGFFDFVYERWAGLSLVPKSASEQDAVPELEQEGRL